MGFREGTPTVTVQLDKERELGFTIGAMKRAQKLGVLNIDADDETAMMLALPEYVWACMDDEGRGELSVEDVGELIHPGNLKAVAQSVGDLFRASQPEEPEGNEPPAAGTKPTAGKKKATSTSSGQSESMTSA